MCEGKTEKNYFEAMKEGFNVAFSAIAFETWFLLHFIKSTRTFSNAQTLVAELKNYYSGYQKAKQNDFANLKEKLDEAIENAVWLRSNNQFEKHVTDLNPWTDVDKLVNELIKQ